MRRPEKGMQRYRLEVGEMDGVKPGNIVGAIANEADLDSEFIGRISIFDEFSTVDLPSGMPRAIQKILFNARINGKIMRLQRESENRFGEGRGVPGGGSEKNKSAGSMRQPHRKARRKGGKGAEAVA